MDDLAGSGLVGVVVVLAMIIFKLGENLLSRMNGKHNRSHRNSFTSDDREKLIETRLQTTLLLEEVKEQTSVLREIRDSLRRGAPS